MKKLFRIFLPLSGIVFFALAIWPFEALAFKTAKQRREAAMSRSLPTLRCGREDPFAPFEAAKIETPLPVPKTELRLNGIIWSETAQKAFINGVIVMRGDTIAGYRVVDIRRDEVVLELDGKRYTLSQASLKEQ